MSDSFDDPEVKAYMEHAVKEMFPKVKGSAFCLNIWTGNPDPKVCMEIGAAVCFNRPLILVVPFGARIPPNLSRLASAIITGDPMKDPTVLKRLQRAIENLLKYDVRTQRQ